MPATASENCEYFSSMENFATCSRFLRRTCGSTASTLSARRPSMSERFTTVSSRLSQTRTKRTPRAKERKIPTPKINIVLGNTGFVGSVAIRLMLTISLLNSASWRARCSSRINSWKTRLAISSSAWRVLIVDSTIAIRSLTAARSERRASCFLRRASS